MKTKNMRKVFAGICAAALAVTAVPFSMQSEAATEQINPEQDAMKIKFDEPVSKGTLTGGSGNFTKPGSDTDWWQQLSLPVGNSHMGVNVYGEVEKEHLTFNHKTLWNGGPSPSRPYTGGNIATVDGQPMAEYMESVQTAFLNNDPNASKMCDKLVGAFSREYGAYQGWGDIYLDFDREPPKKDTSLIIGDGSEQIAYGDGWHYYQQPEWEGGTEHYNDNPGKFSVSFEGTGIQMIGVKGPDMGNFKAYVDDETTAITGSMTKDQKEVNAVLFEISGLPYGQHTLYFESMVNEQSANKAKKTSFDCFKVLEGETIDWKTDAGNDKMTFTGQWAIYDRSGEGDAADWFGKDEVYIDGANAEGAQLTCRFTGTGFELFGAKSNKLGKFMYKVDDGEFTEVNTYAEAFARQSLLKVEGLTKGEHTLTIQAVKDNKVSFDGIVTTMIEKQEPEGETHTETTNYERALDIDNAVATVSYDRDYTHYYREYFASYPDNVIAMKLTAEAIEGAEGAMHPLTFEVSFPVDQPKDASLGKEVTYTTTGDTIEVSGKLKDNDMKLNGRLKVVLNGDGTVAPAEGKDGTLLVSNATEVYIFVTADTDYKMVYPTYRSGETDAQLSAKVKSVMDAAVNKGYDAVKAAAAADYKNIYDRVKIDFGQTVSEKTTDDLIAAYKNGGAGADEKAYLETMIFQYGRYLQISSSREGDRLPANLQGVWLDATGEANNPVAWGSDYHMNVNLQMNYWPTYVTNMAECAEPMIAYMEGLREPGRVTASTYYGIDNSGGQHNGFMANTQNTPFGWTCPGWNFSWGWSPAAVPWMLQNVYEAYEYSGDLDKLQNEIFPMMAEEAQFYMQILKEVTDADGTERYVTIPAYSPEHGPYTAGNVYENVLVWQLFNDCIEAAEALNARTPGTVSETQMNEWKKYRDGLKPIEIGESGQIKEWYDETALGQTASGKILGYEQGHRHMSHLLGLFPGDLVNVDNEAYINAAKVSLENRGDNATGWGIAQRLNAWARTGDGNHAYKIIDQFVKTGIYSNLWDSHPPFQIDGNFGFTSGVAEMLMQSNAGYINLLPAMPENAWQTGSVSGLVARGNFEVSESWADGTLTGAKILSQNGGTCTVQASDWEYISVSDSRGNVTVTPVEGKTGRVSFETVAGETYTLTESTEAPVPPETDESESQETGDSESQETGDSESQETGESESQETGDSESQETGESESQETGDSESQETGESESQSTSESETDDTNESGEAGSDTNETGTPGTSAPDKPDKPSDSVQTGDTAPIIAFALVLFVSAAEIATILFVKARKRQRR